MARRSNKLSPVDKLDILIRKTKINFKEFNKYLSHCFPVFECSMFVLKIDRKNQSFFTNNVVFPLKD